MKKSRLGIACLLGLIVGLGGETLLFLGSQCAKVEAALKDDFRILLFLKSDVDAGRRKVLDEKLLALPDVEGVRYISRNDALAELRRKDPGLVESALIGDNPLSPAYEVRLSGEGFGRVPALIVAAQTVEAWTDIRYKAAQVRTILQAQFYRHLITLVLSCMLCLTAALALASLWQERSAWWQFKFSGFSLAPVLAAVSAAAGAGLTVLIALPMKLLTSWWAWPSGASQAVLVAGAGVAGWVLCGRGD